MCWHAFLLNHYTPFSACTRVISLVIIFVPKTCRLAAALYAAGESEEATRYAEMAVTQAVQVGADATPYVHMANLAVIGRQGDDRRKMLAEALRGAEAAADTDAVAQIETMMHTLH